MSGDGLQSWVSATRGWGWVFVGGTVMALSATWTGIGDGLWAVFTSLAAWVWRLPYVANVVVLFGALAVVAAAAVAARWFWRGRGQ